MNPATSLKACNNHAAALMVAGELMEAYKELCTAMEAAVLASTVGLLNERVTFRSPFDVLAITTTNDTNGYNPSRFQKGNKAMFPWPLVSFDVLHADTDSLDSLSVAAAVALFNMGLACHHALFATSRHKDMPVTQAERDLLLAQAEYRYLQAYEMGRNYDVEVLNMALLINLMEIAYERGDLTAVHSWSVLFIDETKRLSHQTPLEILQCIWAAHLYFTVGLVASRAA